MVEGETKDNLTEGEHGQKWFVSACSALAKEKKLLHKVHDCVGLIVLNEHI